MKLKRRVYQLDLKDTDLTVYLHNPDVSNFDNYLRKLQSVNALGGTMAGLINESAVINVSEETKANVWELVTIVADLIEDGKRRPVELDEAKQLTIWDCLAIIRSVDTMAENALNPTLAAATTQAELLT